MARPLRIEYPGAFYHVINRGNEDEDIYRSVRDRRKFLEYVEDAVCRYSLSNHSYCLMPNHYHLLIEAHEANLSKSIQWLNVSYATYFNNKYQRSGHLFQGRFKSLLVDADEYLKELSRYIHLNPVRANLVSDLETISGAVVVHLLVKKNRHSGYKHTGCFHNSEEPKKKHGKT